MRPERWIHIFVVACGAILILIYNLHQPAVRKGSPVVALVPLTEIESGREPSFVVPEPVSPAVHRTQAVMHSTLSRRGPDPVHVTPASVLKKVRTAAVAAVDNPPAAEKMIPVNRSEADPGYGTVQTVTETAKPAVVEERPAAHPVPVTAEKNGIPAGNQSPSDDRIHREVVTLIRKYIAEQCSLTESGSRPVNLASTGKLPPVEGLRTRPEPARSGRWVLGALAGPVKVNNNPAGLPASGMGADLYLGYKIAGFMQAGIGVGYGQMRGDKTVTAAPGGVLQSDVQMRLFLIPRARISPMVMAGAGYGQYYTITPGSEGEAESIGQKSLPVVSLGAGVEYRISPSASAQIAVLYEKTQKAAFADGTRPGVLEFKAGLTLTLGAPRPIANSSASGLAVIGSRPD